MLLHLSLITGRYFDEISQDTGKYCFGVEDTLKALEMGAVEILIVYENLDIMRYVLHCQGTEGMRIRKFILLLITSMFSKPGMEIWER